ncbi:MAG: cyclic pyranopterin monophosphate synthase MoaC [Kiritimatiellae bacterium]|nr:cyclic pyranopterin monophosphate synthase MoaC [Kiritimatiellia bacterium]
MELSHLNKRGAAWMIDVSRKAKVRRTARTKGKIKLQGETIRLIREGLLKKGDALAVARIAGIAAAKKTWCLVPLCHNIGIEQVSVDFHIVEDGIEIESAAVCTDKTGIEMEALTAVAVAALTLYDMCKGVDRNMKIEAIRVLRKTKEGT